MEVKKIVFNEIKQLLANIKKDNFKLVKVYNDYQNQKLKLIYIDNYLIEKEKELCYYGNKPFTEKEINQLNKIIRALNNVEDKFIQINVEYLNKETSLNTKEIDNIKKEIKNIKKWMFLNRIIYIIIFINIIYKLIG